MPASWGLARAVLARPARLAGGYGRRGGGSRGFLPPVYVSARLLYLRASALSVRYLHPRQGGSVGVVVVSGMGLGLRALWPSDVCLRSPGLAHLVVPTFLCSVPDAEIVG